LAAVVVTLWHLREFRPLDFPQGSFGGIACAPGFSLYLSVDFFLVLSGFVLTHSSDFGSCDWQELGRRRLRFLGHRTARLLPLYIFAKVAAYISGIALGWEGGNGPDWTVMWDFLLSIGFGLFVTPDTPSWLLLLFSVLCQAYLFSINQCLDVYSDPRQAGTRCASSFFLGVCAYRVFQKVRGSDSSEDEGLGAGVATFIETLLMGLVAFVFLGPFKLTDFAAPWLFALVVVCFASQHGAVSQGVSWLRFLGTISYSVYLNQEMILMTLVKTGLMKTASKELALAFYWGALFPYSCLTYYLLEEPCRRHLRNWMDRCIPTNPPPEVSSQFVCRLPQEDPSELAEAAAVARANQVPWYLSVFDVFFGCGCNPNFTKSKVVQRPMEVQSLRGVHCPVMSPRPSYP
jgi:peptidoglycan/LPS O-acetylase OafA/YrhL